jgi:hypothetical protein
MIEAAGLVAELEGALPIRVEHRAESTPAIPVVVLLASDARALATLEVECRAQTLGIGVLVTRGQLGLDPSLAAALLVVLASRRPAGLHELRLVTQDPIVRAQARRLGYEGGIRDALTRSGWSLDGDFAPRARQPIDAELSHLLPGLDVVDAPLDGVGRRVRRASTGMAATRRLRIGGPADLSALDVVVTDDDETLAEPVACGIDTALAVRRSFGRAGSAVGSLVFGRTQYGFRTHRVAGTAEGNVSKININGSFVTTTGVQAMHRARANRLSKTPPAPVSPRFSMIDGVVAHECWHVIEQGYLARRFSESFDMRRELGRALGVDTLEQAITGGEQRATNDERRAYERLRDEVSPYATTTIREATAEMFKLAWCREGEPSPVIATFMQVVADHFGMVW